MNKNRGSLLLKLNVMLMCFCVLLVCVYSSYICIVNQMYDLYSDIEMFRVKRTVFSLLERKIAYDTCKMWVDKNKLGDILVCKNMSGQRTTRFYCGVVPDFKDNIGLYQATNVRGRKEGINPLIPKTVAIDKLKVYKFDNRTVCVVLSMHMVKDRRKKKFAEVIRLCNGRVL